MGHGQTKVQMSGDARIVDIPVRLGFFSLPIFMLLS